MTGSIKFNVYRVAGERRAYVRGKRKKTASRREIAGASGDVSEENFPGKFDSLKRFPCENQI
jgi:hypothetical protein